MQQQLRTRWRVLGGAALALLAGALFVLVRMNATAPVQHVSISPVMSVATRAAAVRQSAQNVVLDWHGVGSAEGKPFHISGQRWQLDLVCGGVPDDAPTVPANVVSSTSPHALIVHATSSIESVQVPGLLYVCPVGASGGQTMARFRVGGDLTLSVECTDQGVAWEVIVTDLL
jgi:hypothetical protein